MKCGFVLLVAGLALARAQLGISTTTQFFAPAVLAPVVPLEEVEDTKFSVDRGVYDAPFTVAVSTKTLNATIVFTLDGSDPLVSATARARPAPAAIFIDPTNSTSRRITPAVVLRVAATKNGMVSTGIDSMTYIFPKEVGKQKRPNGYPAKWSYDVRDESVELIASLKAIPSLAISGDIAGIFDPITGVLGFDDKLGIGEELVRPVTMELIDPAHAFKQSVLAGLKSHSSVSEHGKRSLRLYFDKKYGSNGFQNPLFGAAILNGESAADDNDMVVLRAGSGDSLFSNNCKRGGRASYAADQFVRDSQIEMSGYGARGFFVHLYLNGLYWGMYNVAERPSDVAFWDSYLGGKKGNWTVVQPDEVKGPGAARWALLQQPQLPSAEVISTIVEPKAFAEYILVNMFSGTGDWPSDNWYAAFGEVPNDKARFAVWDAEESWIRQGAAKCGAGQMYSNDGAWVTPALLGVSKAQNREGKLTSDTSLISRIWQSLSATPEFREVFADAVYKHCFNGGALSNAKALGRWTALTDVIRKGVRGESARWGRFRGGGGVWGVDDWEAVAQDVTTMMSNNVEKLVSALRDVQVPAEHPVYYNAVEPPVLRNGSQAIEESQITIENGFRINLRTERGLIVYTTDGSDPHYSENSKTVPMGKRRTLVIGTDTVIKARSRTGRVWSPMRELRVFLAQDYELLQLTEIMYHPDPDGDTEFLELYNAGTSALPLGLMSIVPSLEIEYLAAEPLLQAKSFGLLVRNLTAFRNWYGPVPSSKVLGVFTAGKLSNKKELLEIRAPNGELLISVEYKDGWYDASDGDGNSLVRNDCALEDLSDKLSWRASLDVNGSPGTYDFASACDYVDPSIAMAPGAVMAAIGVAPAKEVLWDSCLGVCACKDLMDPYCCTEWMFDSTCSSKALMSRVCKEKCAA